MGDVALVFNTQSRPFFAKTSYLFPPFPAFVIQRWAAKETA